MLRADYHNCSSVRFLGKGGGYCQEVRLPWVWFVRRVPPVLAYESRPVLSGASWKKQYPAVLLRTRTAKHFVSGYVEQMDRDHVANSVCDPVWH